MPRVNLLPVAATQRFERKRITVTWSKLVLSTLLFAVVAILLARSVNAKQRKLIEQHVLAAKYPREVHAKHENLQRRQRNLVQYESQQLELRSQFSPLVVVRMLHDLKLQLDGALEVVSMEFVDSAERQLNNDGATSRGYVTLQLITSNTSDSSIVMQLIRDTGYFREVNLSSALEKLHPTASDLRFTVRCDF